MYLYTLFLYLQDTCDVLLEETILTVDLRCNWGGSINIKVYKLWSGVFYSSFKQKKWWPVHWNALSYYPICPLNLQYTVTTKKADNFQWSWPCCAVDNIKNKCFWLWTTHSGMSSSDNICYLQVVYLCLKMKQICRFRLWRISVMLKFSVMASEFVLFDLLS